MPEADIERKPSIEETGDGRAVGTEGVRTVGVGSPTPWHAVRHQGMEAECGVLVHDICEPWPEDPASVSNPSALCQNCIGAITSGEF